MTEANAIAGSGAPATGAKRGGGGSSKAVPARRFLIQEAEPNLWLHRAVPALLLLTLAALLLAVTSGRLRPERLLVRDAGVVADQADPMLAGLTAGGAATDQQQSSATAADQQQPSATAADQQQAPAAAADQQQTSAAAAEQQPTSAAAAEQQKVGAAPTGEHPSLTVADQQEATWQSRADGPETEGLPCRESGYCSVGKLQPYIGEVDSSEGCKKALNASCYKKECIHITIGTSGHLVALNFVTRAWQLGLANVMIHAKNKESCDKLATSGYTNVTCVWVAADWFANYEGAKYVVGEVTEQWAHRYLLLARAVWMGYNVFMLDSDSYLYRDPYLYLKKPPLANISFMTLQDGGAQLNGGASYIHNARPEGPAWWTIAAVAERLIFVKTQWDFFMEKHNLSHWHALGHAMMDQPVLSDILAWQFLGYPTLAFSQPQSKAVDTPRMFGLLRYPILKLTYPPEWQPVTGRADDSIVGFPITIPFQNGNWPEIGMGPQFPPRENYTLAFIKTLEEESGYKFYDAYGSPPPSFVMPPNETWSFTPEFLLSSWLARGMNGWWELGPPPPQVMIHLIYIPGAERIGKEYVLKAHNAWTFEANPTIEGRLFASSTPEQQLPRVLALPPGMRLEATSAQDYRDKTAQLVKLALHLGRVLYMPEPVCKTQSWISKHGAERKQEIVDPGTGKKHTKFVSSIGNLLSYGLDDDYHCIWWSYINRDCMTTYIVHIDYRELVRRLPPGTGDPTPDNTVQLEAGATLQRAAEAAAQKEAPHILFLSSMPDFAAPLPDGEGEADKRFKEWSGSCKWMQEVPKLNARRRRRLGELERPKGHAALESSWALSEGWLADGLTD